MYKLHERGGNGVTSLGMMTLTGRDCVLHGGGRDHGLFVGADRRAEPVRGQGQNPQSRRRPQQTQLLRVSTDQDSFTCLTIIAFRLVSLFGRPLSLKSLSVF